MTIFDESQIASQTFAAFGGRNSQLQQPFRAKLGNPLTGEIYVAPESRLYAGQVYLHDVTGDFALPDSSDTGREDQPAGFYTGQLKKNTIDTNLVRFGTEVEVKWRNNRLVVSDLAAEASEYLEGVGARQRESVEINQIAYSLLRPTDPTTMGVVIEGARYVLDDTLYDVPLVVEPDLSASLSGLTVGQGIAVQVEVDPTDASVTLTAGSAFTDTSRDSGTGAVDHSVVFANYPATIDPDLYTVGWVKLYHGMTTITEQDIYPAAEWFSKGAGAGSVSNLPDLGDVDNAAAFTANFVLVGDGAQFETRLLDINDLNHVNASAAPTINTFLIGDGSEYVSGTIENTHLPVVIATKGGTNLSSYTKGDLIYSSATDTLNKLAIGGANQVLTVSATGVPSWMNSASGSGNDYTNDLWKVTGGYADNGTGASNLLATDIGGFTEVHDRPGGFFTGANDDRVTIPSGYAGVYMMGLTVLFMDEDGGYSGTDDWATMTIEIINETQADLQMVEGLHRGFWGGLLRLTITGMYEVAVNDVLRVHAALSVTPEPGVGTENILSATIETWWGYRVGPAT